VKAPLIFSAVLAIVASVVTLVVSSGGTSHTPRYDLAAIAFGVAFIVTLVVAAMLSMSFKENAEHLGRGSGINLSSADRQAKDRRADGAADDDGGPGGA
jgi:preprotein translocase subunit SecY